MKILVTSDTHGDSYNFQNVLKKHRDIDIIIHCGDSRDEIETAQMLYPNKKFVAVKGNCDFGSLLPAYEILKIESKTLFITHGHLYNAKLTMYNLCCAAREHNADMVIFGHTHNAMSDYDDGLYILNPGSLGGYKGTYAVADIQPSGIVTNILSIK